MRKSLAIGALLAAVAPSSAAADITGNVAFSYNTLDDDFLVDKDNYLALSGAVAAPLGGSWNLQFDAEMDDAAIHPGNSDHSATVTAHAFTRTSSYAFGGFVGFSSKSFNGYIVGAEGSLYLDRFSLAGAAFFGGDRDNNDVQITGFGATGTFFLADSFSFGADANWYEFDFGGAFRQDGAIYGVNAEYQFTNSGLSVFGGYHVSDEDYFSEDKEANSFTVGARYNFGASSLIERGRNGASMLGASQLPRSQIFAR